MSGPAGGAMIEFRHVSKTYPGSDNPVVNDLSFEVLEGEICVLVGPSGCGKTTSMRMVNRLIEITEGEILIDGEPNTAMSGTQLRRKIGYAIQQIGLFPHRTIADNIGTVPYLLGWDKGRIRDRVNELLELVGLDADEYRDRYPAELSGGQQQRVGVARALAADPPLMLMDEPFGAVDPITRERLQDEFLHIQENIKKTIVFVTHDIDEAIKIGDKIAILKQGGVLAQFDTPENILSRPASEFVSSFVGADRVLKRLSLTRVSEMDLERGGTLRVSNPGLLLLQDVLEEPELIDWEWLRENFWEDIVPAFQGHIFLSLVSVAIALVIALPVGVISARYRKVYPPVTFVTGILYSIPSLALFAILISIPGVAIGPAPVIIALVAYSLLILIRNTVAGIDSVPPETIDAARGMGLTNRQILFRVELPLALPVIVAGIRIATVTIIGIATIGAYINGGGLGQLIFDGISRQFPTMIIAGAVLATALAIIADLLLLALERYLRPWARARRT